MAMLVENDYYLPNLELFPVNSIGNLQEIKNEIVICECCGAPQRQKDYNKKCKYCGV